MGPVGGTNSQFIAPDQDEVPGSSRPALPHDPPKWTVGGDGDAFKMAVQRWAAYIKRSAPIKESLRMIEATLFDHLVAQLDAPTKAVVDAEVIRGTFDTKADP
jgi:hypothetical protein